jgi:hypothetical protein
MQTKRKDLRVEAQVHGRFAGQRRPDLLAADLRAVLVLPEADFLADDFLVDDFLVEVERGDERPFPFPAARAEMDFEADFFAPVREADLEDERAEDLAADFLDADFELDFFEPDFFEPDFFELDFADGRELLDFGAVFEADLLDFEADFALERPVEWRAPEERDELLLPLSALAFSG